MSAPAAGLQGIFVGARCTGTVCVRDLSSGAEVALDAGRAVVPASVLKVLVALEAERQLSAGRLDPAERVLLRASARTPGPVGFSLYSGDVELCVGDLLVPMLTISDNVATDALLARVGIDACNATAGELGLEDTAITSDLATLVDSIGVDAGFAGWQAMSQWLSGDRSEAELEEVDERVCRSSALDPKRAWRTTARDMCKLLEALWTDRAASPESCGRIRGLMGQQLTRARLAAGFERPVRVSAKSGGLAGVVRNEVGVVEYPDGSRYCAAVFTWSEGGDEAQVNSAIGRAAAAAVAALR